MQAHINKILACFTKVLEVPTEYRDQVFQHINNIEEIKADIQELASSMSKITPSTFINLTPAYVNGKITAWIESGITIECDSRVISLTKLYHHTVTICSTFNKILDNMRILNIPQDIYYIINTSSLVKYHLVCIMMEIVDKRGESYKLLETASVSLSSIIDLNKAYPGFNVRKLVTEFTNVSKQLGLNINVSPSHIEKIDKIVTRFTGNDKINTMFKKLSTGDTNNLIDGAMKIVDNDGAVDNIINMISGEKPQN